MYGATVIEAWWSTCKTSAGPFSAQIPLPVKAAVSLQTYQPRCAPKAWGETCESILPVVKLIEVQILLSTLVPGYEDVGCVKCTNDCARSNSNVFICLRCASRPFAVTNRLIDMLVLHRYRLSFVQGRSVGSNMCISRISGCRPKAHGGESRTISFSLQAMLWFSSFQRCLGSVVNNHLCGSSRRSSVDSRSFVTVVRQLCPRLASSVLAGETKIEPCRCTKHIKTRCYERQVTFQKATRQK